MTSVLLVDDHPIVRKGLSAVLAETNDVHVIGEASNGNEALEKARSGKPDLILLNISMPGKDGLEVLKQLHLEMPHVKALILSAFSERQYALRCLKAGAQGYLTKQCALDELLNAIRKVTAGGRYISAALADLLAAEIDTRASSEPHERLSDREFQVLCLLGQGKSVAQISQILSISNSAVSKYRAQVLHKLNLKTTVELIRYAFDNDLVGPVD